MSEGDFSLVQKDQAQGRLFDDAKLEESLEQYCQSTGISSGELLFKRNKRLYEAALKLAAADFGTSQIAEVLSIHERTVQSILNRDSQAIADFRKRISSRWRKIAEQSAEQLGEALEQRKIPASQLTMTAGIALDKANNLQDEDETSPRVDEERLEDVASVLQSLPGDAGGEIVEAEVTDETGLEPRACEQKEVPGGAGETVEGHADDV